MVSVTPSCLQSEVINVVFPVPNSPLNAKTLLPSVITLPVEFDASSRALKWLNASHITLPQEHEKAKDALKWAALTYVVAALASITMLVQYILIYQGRRD